MVMPVDLRLYALVDPERAVGRDPAVLARLVAQGGATLVQLRDKHSDTRAMVARARAIKAALAPLNVPLLINDRIDVALAAEADGVHLGQDDVPVAVAREMLGPARWIGFSTHSEAQLEAASGLGADYLSLGPIFATTSKAAADPVIGPDVLRAARPRITEPVVAIGGITAATAREVLDAGADAISVIAAVVRAPDVARATAELLALAG
jgi:thiamine-phosphate pyrophosphorylase